MSAEGNEDVVDELSVLDPNLEPPLPAVTPRVESAPKGSNPKNLPPITSTVIEPISIKPESSAVIQRDISSQESNEESGYNGHDEFQPPPPLEFEPTIDPSTFNQLSNDVASKPVIPKSPAAKEKEVTQSKPVATDAIHWTELSYDLGLQGFAQAIATNSVVGNYEQNHLQLILTPDFMKFVNDDNQEEICQAIASKLGLSLVLDLQIQDKLEAETPSETRLRKQGEHRQAAIELIKQGQTVKKLQRAFGAELVESSVQLIPENKGQKQS